MQISSGIFERPLVLCISGHDPGGGAGVQADIEAVGALGGHALTAITALTVQDTRDVARVSAVSAQLLRQQIDRLIADSVIAAIKVGLLGAPAHIPVVLHALERTRVPLVVDPVLRAGGGAQLADEPLARDLLQRLLPRADVITPNAAEARLLTGLSDAEAAGRALQAAGARNVLVTGGDESGGQVVNHWFDANGQYHPQTWPRLEHRFHGAGCTLAASLATLLARGRNPRQAAFEAQGYTYHALECALRTGKGRLIPGRVRSGASGT